MKALNNALDLHQERFPEQLAQNPEWAGRKIEGPNISNVFKRTFYQIAFKFQVTKRDTSVGCALALPQPVWDSWQPFLGAPELRELPDGTWRLLDDQEASPSDWIYVFDIDSEPGPSGHPAPIRVSLVIGTDAATLSRAAFEIAPARAVAHGGEHESQTLPPSRPIPLSLWSMLCSTRCPGCRLPWSTPTRSPVRALTIMRLSHHTDEPVRRAVRPGAGVKGRSWSAASSQLLSPWP